MATKKTTTPAKGVKAKTKKTVQPKHIGLVKNDPIWNPMRTPYEAGTNMLCGSWDS